MFILCFVSVVVVDQLTKYSARAMGVVVSNTGVSFNLLAEFSSSWLLPLLLVCSFGIAYYSKPLWKKHPVWSGIFWGGVFSNLLDRVMFGGVVDWYTIPFTQVRNNVADVAIGIGAAMIALQILKENKHV